MSRPWKSASESSTRRRRSPSRLEGSADERRRRPIEKALADDDGVLWLTDTQGPHGRGPVRAIAYVEVERRRRGASASASAGAEPGPPRRSAVIDLLDRRLLFFTGKGGVGKSTVTAATALLARGPGQARAARRGRRQGQPHRAVRARSPSGSSRSEVHPGVLAMQMNTEASLREYLKLNLRIPVVGRVGPIATCSTSWPTRRRASRRSSPSARCAGRSASRSRVAPTGTSSIVDAAATGHVVAQLDAPRHDPRAGATSARSAARPSG